MSVNQRGFSLTEVLIAMAIGSILMLSSARFLPGLQQVILRQEAKQDLEEDAWLSVMAIGKQIQRAGYCVGQCQGAGLIISQDGHCVIVQWDANSNGRWENSPNSEAEQTGFRLASGVLETQRGATHCDGKGWDKLTDPDRVLVQNFSVRQNALAGFSPEFVIELSASRKGFENSPVQVLHYVTGFNL
ncbi:prepilin peptidase-dependent protein [Lelliottia sp. WAP21]|uniref:prepilin peptidase-dependent protein n=1 Tax=Lelliottia sp. WAP21 TaxID=2877426 RepID=UPI001E3FC9A9|nr:prepilin peptidase-dependent protein [Lelliottia sp. WAP21]